MSVVIATITDKQVILCADKQVTNMQTGEVKSDGATKIEKWSSSVGVSCCGNGALCEVILNAVRRYVAEEGGVDNFDLEDIADFFAQAYYAAVEEYSNMPSNIISKFIVAGKLSSGKVGVIELLLKDGIADAESIVAKELPVTLFHEPEDMSGEECNLLFQKAIAYTKKNNKYHQDPSESIHRRTVRYISERSKFVGHKSDYLVIRPQDTKEQQYDSSRNAL